MCLEGEFKNVVLWGSWRDKVIGSWKRFKKKERGGREVMITQKQGYDNLSLEQGLGYYNSTQ